MNEEHKKIWSAYIKAKQQFTQRLSLPIIIKKGSLKLRAGYLTAEIEQQKNENELLSILKKTFDVPETDIRLDKGYFLMPNDKGISEAQFQKFRDETDRFYLDFEPKPALEGYISLNSFDYDFKQQFGEIKDVFIKNAKNVNSRITLKKDNCFVVFNQVLDTKILNELLFYNVQLIQIVIRVNIKFDKKGKKEDLEILLNRSSEVTNYYFTTLDSNNYRLTIFIDSCNSTFINNFFSDIDLALSNEVTTISTHSFFSFSPFQEIQEKLIRKFPSIHCKVNRKNDKLKITYHYKYEPNSGKNVLDFKNFIEQECEKHQFIWKLNQEIEHTLKFITRVNEEKKAFEENEKFKRLLKNDIKIGDKIIGILDKVDFPKLRIRLSVPVTEEQLQDVTEILPDLTGELEKDARLEDTIAKLEGDGKGLANPKIKEFIFDSEKATPLKYPNLLIPESKEWQEVKFHQNPKSNLNDSQIRGVLSSLHAKDLAIIQGPPGTGKSTAISEIIWHHIRTNSKQRILLTSESHLAVDNALDKLGTIPNGLVKPVRFGVEEDVFEETENQKGSKIENEGKRYSYKRFKTWVESDKESTPIENYKVLSDNSIQKWASRVGKRAIQNNEQNQDISHFLSDWKDILENPEQELKQLFYDNYMQNVNVVGATSSSISEIKFTKFKEKENKKGSIIKQFAKGNFLWDFEEVFGEVKQEPWDKSTKIKFDVIITDEASKATPPELALPMLYGKKNIVVGDHRQLPPSLDENDFTTTLKNIGTPESRELAKFFKDNTKELNTSQFEKLFLGLSTNSSIRTTFNQQYRMHSSINKVIEQFYIQDGGLFCGLDPEKENIPNFSEPQSRWHGFEYPNFITPDTHCIWVNVDTPEVKDGTSRTNYGEIEACEKIIKILQNSKGFEEMQNYWKKEEDKEIGLISFYGTQVGKLWKMTQDKFPNLPIRVKTVDRFQGMERNLLIVSMVRSNKIANNPEQKPDFELYENLGYPSQTSLGFAELPNRLNVALSRAKRLLIIVGNATHFSQKDIYKNVYESIKNSPHGKIINNIQDFNL